MLRYVRLEVLQLIEKQIRHTALAAKPQVPRCVGNTTDRFAMHSTTLRSGLSFCTYSALTYVQRGKRFDHE
jgi:hypothetical protein